MKIDPNKIVSGYLSIKLMSYILRGDVKQRAVSIGLILNTLNSTEVCHNFLKVHLQKTEEVSIPKVDVVV